MRASAALTIDAVDGRAFASDVRCEPPLTIRRAADRFLVVGTAAAPVRGDELTLAVDVLPDVSAHLGTVAATMAWPGPTPTDTPPSRMTTTITVGAAAHLRWHPEPTVSVAGSDHVAVTRIDLAADATCAVIEEFSLGRWNEASGRLATDLHVTRAGRALLHHAEQFGPDVPGAGGLTGIAMARHVVMAVVVGRPVGDPCVAVTDPMAPDATSAAWLPLRDDAAVLLAAGPDRPATLATAAEVAPIPFLVTKPATRVAHTVTRT